jgi:hypothetical protein
MSNKFIDLTNKRFSKLIVIRKTEKTNHYNNPYWECKCDCGNTFFSLSYPLRVGKRTSCGCSNPNKFQDLTGRRYGLLTVISFSHREGSGNGKSINFWKCKCDCGNETTVRRSHLNRGKIKSCGCLLSRIGKDSPHFKGYEGIPMSYYTRAKNGAQDRGRNLEFSITIQDLWDLFIKQNGKCSLTGEELSFGSQQLNKKTLGTASLDRIDSSKGYTKNNIQWVHKDVNLMKNHYDQSRFIEVCKEVANHCKSDIIIS